MTRNMRRMLGLALIAACSAPAAAQSLEWTRVLGTPELDEANGVAVDGAGGVYITGYTFGSLGGPSAGSVDAFLAKYGASGVLEWTRQLGTPDWDSASGVAVDDAGGVYIAGGTSGSLGGPSSGLSDAFLAKYDASGVLEWTRQLGTSESDSAAGVAVDGAGDVYIAGRTRGSLGGPGAGGVDTFLAKYDASGALQWTRQLGTSSTDYPNGVAVDGAGGVYITGSTAGSLGGPSVGGGDAFLAKYDASGTLEWTRQIGTSDWDIGVGVAGDGAGGVYITGRTDGSLGGPTAGEFDGFLMKFDASGALQWSRQFGTSVGDLGNAVAVDGAGDVYVTGTTFGSLGGPSAGEADAFLAMYNASGALQWRRQFGASTSDYARGVALDGAGGVYITGFTGTPGAQTDAFLAKYGPLVCYANCDGSFSLDFFDFLCFQELFAAGDSLADCDGSGTLDFQDFLCFQGEFAAGCP